MGRKDKKIPKSPSRFCHSYEAFRMQISTRGGSHPDAHRAMGTFAVNFASRNLGSLPHARATLFHSYAALLVANIAFCFMSGVDFEV